MESGSIIAMVKVTVVGNQYYCEHEVAKLAYQFIALMSTAMIVST